jgi:hypothetical protein
MKTQPPRKDTQATSSTEDTHLLKVTRKQAEILYQMMRHCMTLDRLGSTCNPNDLAEIQKVSTALKAFLGPFTGDVDKDVPVTFLAPDLSTRGQLANQLKTSGGITKTDVLEYFGRLHVIRASSQRFPDQISGTPDKVDDYTLRIERNETWRNRPSYIYEFGYDLIYYIEHYDICVPQEILNQFYMG